MDSKKSTLNPLASMLREWGSSSSEDVSSDPSEEDSEEEGSGKGSEDASIETNSEEASSEFDIEELDGVSDALKDSSLEEGLPSKEEEAAELSVASAPPCTEEEGE